MDYKVINGIQFVRLEGSVLDSDAPKIERRFEEVISNESLKVILDLSDARHICSAALSHIIFLNKKLKSRSGSLKLIVTDEDLWELFDLTMLNRTIDLYKTSEEALQAFEK